MKHVHLLIATFLFFSQLMLAQSSFKLDPKTSTYIDKVQIECIYNYTVNAPLKDSINKKQLETYTTILQASAISSKFWDWHSFKQDSIIYFSPEPISNDSIKKLKRIYDLSIRNLFVPVIIKNYPKGKITVTDEITPDDFIYTENKMDRKWELLEDTLTVCGYLCNKAITSFGGRQWLAWYTPDITLSDGPWKLYGLPGLILKAQDSTLTHTFEAKTIRNSSCLSYLKKNIQQIKTKKDLFIKNKNEFEKNPFKFLDRFKTITCTMVKGGTYLINGKRCSSYSKTMYCPLELE